jgi:hypothetical protein
MFGRPVCLFDFSVSGVPTRPGYKLTNRTTITLRNFSGEASAMGITR